MQERDVTMAVGRFIHCMPQNHIHGFVDLAVRDDQFDFDFVLQRLVGVIGNGPVSFAMTNFGYRQIARNASSHQLGLNHTQA